VKKYKFVIKVASENSHGYFLQHVIKLRQSFF